MIKAPRKRVRENGQGTIYYVGTGKRKRRWRVELPSTYQPVLDDSGNQVYKSEGIPAVKRVSRTLGYYATKQEATEALNKYLKNPEYYSELTFSGLWEEWYNESDLGESQSSVNRYRGIYNALTCLHNRKIKDLTKPILRDYLKEIPQDYLADNAKMVLQTVFGYAVQMDYMPTNIGDFPYKKRNGKENKKDNESKLLSADLIKQIWEHTEIPYCKFLLCLLYSGMRKGEMFCIKEFHFDEGYLLIGDNAKNDYSKNRVVPIHPKVEAFFREWSNKPFLKESSIQNYSALRKAEKAIGVIVNCHDCRHTFISRMQITEGVKEIVIQKIVGHAPSNTMQKTYTHITPEAMIEAVKLLNYGT